MTRNTIEALALSALAFPAGAFELAFPLDCILGQTCYIQQYVDHDPGPAAQDFTCGGLSYEGHDGTDIALPTRNAMATGINVLAAAPGTVKGVRDAVADFVAAIPGKECGNGVVVDHGGGWETQYCHMKQGSVTAKAGDVVNAGTPLGQVGQSGMAAFPHLHLSVRRNGIELDPFAPEALTTCGALGDDLWLPEITYQAGGLLGVGISTEVPDYQAIKNGLASPDLPATAPALVIWAYLFGNRAGDAVLFEISGPEGVVITERTVLEKPQALSFRAVGKKLKTDGWPQGAYTGSARLRRDSEEISAQSIVIQVKSAP